MRRPDRPYAAPEWAWTLTLFCGFLVSGWTFHTLGFGAGLIAAAPFVGLTVILANTSAETRQPTREEALTLIEAGRLLGRELEWVVRLPRTRRMWADRVITGVGLGLVLIVIGTVAG